MHIRRTGAVARFMRAVRSLTAERSMIVVMPCARCDYELTADDLALVPQLSARFREHMAEAHAKNAERGHQKATGR